MRWCSFTLFAQIILCCRLGRFVLRKWWIKSERQKLLQFDFFFFPLAAIKTWEKSKPDDVFQKLHDSLFDCRFASVPIVLKNPLKNSLQSHTAASTNVIYIGLQLYCFICVCSSFGFFNKHHFYLAVDYWSNWHFIPVFTSLLTPVAGVSHSASQNDAFRHEGGLHLTRKHTKYSLKAWYQRMS